MRKAAFPLLLAALCAAPLCYAAAQQAEPGLPRYTWLDVAYPKLFYTLQDGLTAGAYFAVISPLGFRDYDLPPAYRAAFSISGQLSTSGSRELVLESRLPQLFPGWRLVGSFSVRRRARENYFGIGNDAGYDSRNVTAGQEHYYRSLQVRWTARTEVQRRVAGGLRLLAGFHAERWRVDTLSGPSQLRIDAMAGADPAIGRWVSDVSVRAGAVFDTRDSETAPHRGVLLEFIHAKATSALGSDLDYTRTTASAAGYVPIGELLVVAARVVGQRMGGSPVLGSYYLVEASDRPYEGVGGPASHRALFEHRLLGRHKLFANLDVRYDLYAVPTLARLTLVGFLDAGRVFEGEEFRLTTEGMKVGGGGGVFFQFGRAGILGSTLGYGPDGFTLQAHTRWTY
ncbi:Outer membrane protein assembly factor BamA [bacterium HR33]|nr:Outer membrane protein assembly factor BamA [bacterium HR33]